MNFKKWFQMQEAGGLFTTQGWPQIPSSSQQVAMNKDMYLKQFGAGGSSGSINPMRGATAQPGASTTQMPTPQGAMAGSGMGLGNQWPKRMTKKMPKK